jgi:hypothetical protein
VVVTRRVEHERKKSTVNGENRMLMEVVDPETLTGDHVQFRKETGKSELMEGERGEVVEEGRQWVPTVRPCHFAVLSSKHGARLG